MSAISFECAHQSKERVASGTWQACREAKSLQPPKRGGGGGGGGGGLAPHDNSTSY